MADAIKRARDLSVRGYADPAQILDAVSRIQVLDKAAVLTAISKGNQ